MLYLIISLRPVENVDQRSISLRTVSTLFALTVIKSDMFLATDLRTANAAFAKTCLIIQSIVLIPGIKGLH